VAASGRGAGNGFFKPLQLLLLRLVLALEFTAVGDEDIGEGPVLLVDLHFGHAAEGVFARDEVAKDRVLCVEMWTCI
jgi:hypothetical protein